MSQSDNDRESLHVESRENQKSCSCSTGASEVWSSGADQ